METTEAATRVDRIVMLLERIADTLDVIAKQGTGVPVVTEESHDAKLRRLEAFAASTGLTVRARKVLMRAGIASRGEINEERLRGIRQCGPGTLIEIMEYKHRSA
jgi:DNA-directed RNA polymerase alpha subunit